MKKRFYLLAMLYMGSSLLWAKAEVKGSEVVTGWKRSRGASGVWEVTLPNTFFGGHNPFNERLYGDWLWSDKVHHTADVYLNDVSLYEAYSKEKVFTPDTPAVSLERRGLTRFSKDFVPTRSDVFVNSTGTLPLSASGICLSRKGVLVTAYGSDTPGGQHLVRLWEQAGEDGNCTVTFPQGSTYTTAQPCDLRGQAIGEPLPVHGGQLTIPVKAYAPVTLLLSSSPTGPE